jgi:periplasmic protein TonB
VGQLGRRQAVLFSLIVHLMIVSTLANRTREVETLKPKVSPTPPPRLVFIPRSLPAPAPARPAVPPPPPAPPPTTLARAQPRPPLPPLEMPRPEGPPPTTRPTPPPDKLKDKISIGTPDGPNSTVFSPDKQGPQGPSREGRPGAPSPAVPPQSASDEVQGVNRQRPGGGQYGPVAPEDRSITGSIRRLEQRIGDLSPTGEGGAVRQMGPLFFDPEGADFTAWINHWRNEVYRNWIVPQAVLFGFRSGHVDFEFTVERDGSMSSVRMLKSSGVRALDRAAENALRGSRFMPLPGDYRPPRVTIQVTFIYNEAPPQGS